MILFNINYLINYRQNHNNYVIIIFIILNNISCHIDLTIGHWMNLINIKY